MGILSGIELLISGVMILGLVEGTIIHYLHFIMDTVSG